MKYKVTVELDEGVKYTRTGIITSESALLLANKQLNKENVDALSLLRHTELGKAMIQSAGDLGQAAMGGIIDVLGRHGFLFDYNKRLTDYDDEGNADFIRATYLIKDINEFIEFKRSLEKDEFIKDRGHNEK